MPLRSLTLLVSISALFALGFTRARAAWHHHSVSISDGRKQPITDCSDLHIRFDDRDAVVRSEERSLTKTEAPVLRVHPHANGGVCCGFTRMPTGVCRSPAGTGTTIP